MYQNRKETIIFCTWFIIKVVKFEYIISKEEFSISYISKLSSIKIFHRINLIYFHFCNKSFFFFLNSILNINYQILHQSEENKSNKKSSQPQMILNFSKYKSNLNRRKEYIVVIILAPIGLFFFFTNSNLGGIYNF